MNQQSLDKLDADVQEAVQRLIGAIDTNELLQIKYQLAGQEARLRGYIVKLTELQYQMSRSLRSLANSNVNILERSQYYKAARQVLYRVQRLLTDSVLPEDVYARYPKDFDYMLAGTLKEDIPAISRVYKNYLDFPFSGERFDGFLRGLQAKVGRFINEHFTKMILQAYYGVYAEFSVPHESFLRLDAEMQALYYRYAQVLQHFSFLVRFLFDTEASGTIEPVLLRIRSLEDAAVRAFLKRAENLIRVFTRCAQFTVCESEYFSPFSEAIEPFSRKPVRRGRRMASEKCSYQLDISLYSHITTICDVLEADYRVLVTSSLPFDFTQRFIEFDFNFQEAAQVLYDILQNDTQKQRLSSLYPVRARFIENYAADFIRFWLVCEQRFAQFFSRLCGDRWEVAAFKEAQNALRQALQAHFRLVFNAADFPGAVLIVQQLLSSNMRDLAEFYAKLARCKMQVAFHEAAPGEALHGFRVFAVRLGCMVRGYSDATREAFERLAVFNSVLQCVEASGVTPIERANCLLTIAKIGGQDFFAYRAKDAMAEVTGIVRDEEFLFSEMRRWRRGSAVI